MSFLKIKDPSKRDKLVAKYIKIKNKIQNDFHSERLGEQSLYEDFGKIFKPITKQQQKSSEEIVSKFAPLQEAIENMPPALPWDMPQPEALLDAPAEPEALPNDPAKPPLPDKIGRIAEEYLRTSYGEDGDKSHYGLKSMNGQFYIGKNPIKIDGNNLVVNGKRYRGTPGLWQLITMKEPEPGFPTKEDEKNYGEILFKADAIRHPKNPNSPYESNSFKWMNMRKKQNKMQREKRNAK